MVALSFCLFISRPPTLFLLFSSSLPVDPNLLIISKRCKVQHHHNPPLGCHWSCLPPPAPPSPESPSLWSKPSTEMECDYSFFLCSVRKNYNTKTERWRSYANGIWRGFHSSVSLNNLFTIPFIASPLGGGVSINSDTFSQRFCRLVGSSSTQEKKV